MQRLLIRNISKLVSCDESDTVYENVDLYAEDGVIRAIGPKLEKPAEEVLDASHMLCYPGLINTHHHLYQQFSRNLPQVQNMELFDWLKTLYEIWKNLDTDVIRLSSLTGMGELMKHGCTTCFDHHYVFPAGAGDLIGTQFEAAYGAWHPDALLARVAWTCRSRTAVCRPIPWCRRWMKL